MLAEATYRTVVGTSAAYDLAVTAPFMTPWTLMFILDLLKQLHTYLGLPGAFPEFEISPLLFAGLLACVVVVCSLARLRLKLKVLGRYDALARLLLAIWQIYAVANGATPLLLIFTVFEIGFGVAQSLPSFPQDRGKPSMMTSAEGRHRCRPNIDNSQVLQTDPLRKF